MASSIYDTILLNAQTSHAIEKKAVSLSTFPLFYTDMDQVHVFD